MSRVSYVDAVMPDTGPRIPAGRTEPTRRGSSRRLPTRMERSNMLA